MKRILLETAGAAVGEAAFLYASYVALNAAGAFNEATRPGFPRWGINLGVPLATGLGATLGVIAGARLLEREPPLVAALLGGVFGAAWLSGAMFAQSTSPGSLPDGYQSLAGLLPAACAVIGVELAFGERMTSQNVTVALAPLIFRGRSSGLSVAGRF